MQHPLLLYMSNVQIPLNPYIVTTFANIASITSLKTISDTFRFTFLFVCIHASNKSQCNISEGNELTTVRGSSCVLSRT